MICNSEEPSVPLNISGHFPQRLIVCSQLVWDGNKSYSVIAYLIDWCRQDVCKLLVLPKKHHVSSISPSRVYEKTHLLQLAPFQIAYPYLRLQRKVSLGDISTQIFNMLESTSLWAEDDSFSCFHHCFLLRFGLAHAEKSAVFTNWQRDRDRHTHNDNTRCLKKVIFSESGIFRLHSPPTTGSLSRKIFFGRFSLSLSGIKPS